MDNQLTEISIRYSPKIPASQKTKILHSSDAYKCFMRSFNLESLAIKEEAGVLFLNRANRVLGYYKLSSGGLIGTVVDPRLILGIALKTLASSIILAHNHPSGEIEPSKQDEKITKQLKDVAALMEIKLLDHLIITAEKYYSFADEGLI